MLNKHNERVKNNEYKDARSNKKQYELKTIEFSFGKRKAYYPINDETREILQISRGPASNQKCDSIEQLATIAGDGDTHNCEKRLKSLLNISSINISKYLEIGFRSIDSLKLSQKYFQSVIGIDINPLSVEIAKLNSFESYCVDLVNISNVEDIKFNATIAGCYHVLEHIHKPDIAISNIIKMCENDAIIQFEIPIENDNPNLYFGHMFGFHQNDLRKMLELNNCEIIQNYFKDGCDHCVCRIKK